MKNKSAASSLKSLLSKMQKLEFNSVRILVRTLHHLISELERLQIALACKEASGPDSSFNELLFVESLDNYRRSSWKALPEAGFCLSTMLQFLEIRAMLDSLSVLSRITSYLLV